MVAAAVMAMVATAVANARLGAVHRAMTAAATLQVAALPSAAALKRHGADRRLVDYFCCCTLAWIAWLQSLAELFCHVVTVPIPRNKTTM